MKHINTLLSVPILTVAALTSGCSQSSPTPALDAGAVIFTTATINVSPSTFTFPDTAVGDTSSATKFTVSNLGNEASGPISHVIEGTSEFQITGSTCAQPLGSQQSCDVTVIYRPVTAGGKSAKLIVSSSPGTAFSVLLNGGTAAVRSVRLDTTVLDFPATLTTAAIPTPTSPTATVIVTNVGTTPAGPFSAEISGDDREHFGLATNSCNGQILSGQGTCTVTVRFRPNSSGVKLAILEISAKGVDLPTVSLSGMGLEPAKLAINPATRSLGSLPIGMKSSFTFDITNTGGQETGKLGVKIDGASFGEITAMPDPSCDVPLPPQGTCQVSVVFAPTVAGMKTATLRVSASPGGLVNADITATAEPMSIQGLIVLSSPAGVEPFGSVGVGETSTGFFVLENKGTTATGKPNPTISGSNATEFVLTDSTCPDRFEVGTFCSLTIRFTPLYAGLRTANLQVFAPPSAFANLPLHGTATAAPQLRVSRPTAQFSSRRVGTGLTTTPTEFIFSSATGMTGPVTVMVDGDAAADFPIAYNECQNLVLTPGRSCRVGVRFVPTIVGNRTASLAASATPGSVVRSTLFGTGTN
jgi:hypothetical protein